MLKKRLIPILLLKNGNLVRSESFNVHQIIGNPFHEVQRFNQWNVDELIYLDISNSGYRSTFRSDMKLKVPNSNMDILKKASKHCFMPLTWGGKIQTIQDMHNAFMNGADKIAVNSAAFKNPGLIQEAAKIFGKQAIVISIDVLQTKTGKYEVYIENGKIATGLCPYRWAVEVEKLGAGEILLQCINRDGKGGGYDLELIKSTVKVTNIPIIALSGVGNYSHFVQGIEADASAVAAANIWHFKELVDRNAKRILFQAGIDVRYEND